MHFGKISKAAEVLAKKGLITFKFGGAGVGHVLALVGQTESEGAAIKTPVNK
jgi:hypothetical protein